MYIHTYILTHSRVCVCLCVRWYMYGHACVHVCANANNCVAANQ